MGGGDFGEGIAMMMRIVIIGVVIVVGALAGGCGLMVGIFMHR